MALVRKGSRWIVVDGWVYRWRLRGRPTYFQGVTWSPCTFSVEHAATPGATLAVITDQPHPSNWFGSEATPVLPSAVTRAIERALREGWTPSASGSPFTSISSPPSLNRPSRARRRPGKVILDGLTVRLPRGRGWAAT